MGTHTFKRPSVSSVEFLLDKETVHVNWESGVEDGLQVRGGFGPVDASHQRTHH